MMWKLRLLLLNSLHLFDTQNWCLNLYLVLLHKGNWILDVVFFNFRLTFKKWTEWASKNSFVNIIQVGEQWTLQFYFIVKTEQQHHGKSFEKKVNKMLGGATSQKSKKEL